MRGTLSAISDIHLDLTLAEFEKLRKQTLEGTLAIRDHTGNITGRKPCTLAVENLQFSYQIKSIPEDAAYDNIIAYTIYLSHSTFVDMHARILAREDSWLPVFVDRWTPQSAQFMIHVR
mgnify:FL=1